MLYHIIVNPIAGRKKADANLNLLQKYILENNIHCKIYFSRDSGHPQKLASQIEIANPEGGTLIIFGGDGTLSEALNGIKDLSKWKIGVIPMGSGNDLATKLNLPKGSIRQSFDVILKGECKKIDYLLVNKERCFNIAGTGVDIDILKRFETYTKMHGSLRYLRATIVSLIKFKGEDYKITLDDGKEFQEHTFIVAFCNGSQFGGGIKMGPKAVVDDGYITYVNARMVNKLNILRYLPKLLNGKITKTKESFYQSINCKKAILERVDGKEFDIEIDGQFLTNSKFEIEIVPSGLNIFC